MSEAAKEVRNRHSARRLLRILPLAAVLIALLIALFLVSGVQQQDGGNSASLLRDGYVWVLVLTLLALVVLLWAIGHRLLTLVRRVRAQSPGALLSARWVRNFLVLSLPPALIVYFFSVWFLNSTIDSWFDVEVERALADSLTLGQQFLDTRTLEVRNQLRETAVELQDLREEGDLLREALLAQVRATGPVELSVLEEGGTLLATANINALTGLPERAGDFALLQAIERGEYAAAEPAANGELQIRVLLSMPPRYPGQSPRLLQAIYPLPADITALTGSIEQEYHRYQNVSYLRASLKQSFLLILSLVLLLTVLLAILAALTAARRMVAPLSRLSTATRQVAEGDFGRDVEAGDRDEIGFLVSSFNDMTQALKRASQSEEQSRAELQAQGDYLETVLGNLSSGVLTLDANENIIKANHACREILGDPLTSLGELPPHLEPFVTAVRHQRDRGKAAWQQEIQIQRAGSPLVLLARGSNLRSANAPVSTSTSTSERTLASSSATGTASEPDKEGQVIVFDDVTVLNQAQREAAWAEVARRLAHEVKNPLTPIRLAAERLRMKLSGKLGEDDRAMLDRASNTIVSQVEALRTLVDAFGDYAREPVLSRAPIRLDELVREVVMLYQQGDAALEFDLQLCPGPEGLSADAGRLRQMLHNLICNAKEAAGDGPARMTIASRIIETDNRHWVLLELRDGGPGFPAAVLQNPFEPYVTHKPGGSGLGLAISRKIVSEHDGRISLGNAPGGGAEMTILLPLHSRARPA